ncbi:hypothetical protein ACIQMV_38445, partial [Streptomyces sp. NPDC091412]
HPSGHANRVAGAAGCAAGHPSGHANRVAGAAGCAAGHPSGHANRVAGAAGTPVTATGVVDPAARNAAVRSHEALPARATTTGAGGVCLTPRGRVRPR